jgi:hypothetical protein
MTRIHDTPEMRRPTGSAVLVLLVAIACESGGGQEEGTALLPAEIGPPAAMVVSTDYQTGSYSIVGLPDLGVARDAEVIHQDAACRFDPVTGLVFIVARLGANAIDVVDPRKDWRIVKEYSVEAGGERSNPQDLAAVSPERAYVSRFNDPELLVVHPTEGTVTGRIDLSEYADDDGVPEAGWLYHLDGKVYLLLGRLRDSQHPVSRGSLLALDGESGEVEEEVRLSAANPFGKLRYSRALQRLVIIESGSWGERDGGIEFFDPTDNSLSGLLIDEKELKGDVVDAVVVSETVAYAIVGRPTDGGSKTVLVGFDPSTGEITDELLESDKWVYTTVELSPDGTELWVADRSRTAPGVRILDAGTGTELTGDPIDVGLPPFMICFVP